MLGDDFEKFCAAGLKSETADPLDAQKKKSSSQHRRRRRRRSQHGSREAEAAKPREVIHISSAQLALLRLEGRLRFLFQPMSAAPSVCHGVVNFVETVADFGVAV